MRFDYQYRTSTNELKSGVIVAADKDAAYALLKTKGIRPARLMESPGFANKLFGKGKRWMAIAALIVIAAVAMSRVASLTARNERMQQELAADQEYERRGQIYGDPGVLASIFSPSGYGTWAGEGERILIAYAVPCLDERTFTRLAANPSLDALALSITTNSVFSSADLDEVAKLKRIVNWMKREARQYVSDGGSVEQYLARLRERRASEHSILMRAKQTIRETTDETKSSEINRNLREMGLPMVHEFSPLTSGNIL